MTQIIRKHSDNAAISDVPMSRVAVITGAARGVGAAVAAQLASRGQRLVLVDEHLPSLIDSTERCRQLGGAVLMCHNDVRGAQAAAVVYEKTITTFGRVDDLLLFAGVIHSGSVAQSTLDDLVAVIEINLIAMIRFVSEALPLLSSTGSHPRILTIASAIEAIPYPGYASYISSKAGVRAFTASLRNELRAAQHPVTVSCGVLGGIDTQIVAHGTAADPHELEHMQARFTRRIARTSADDAARQLLAGIDRGHATIRVGADAYLAEVLRRVLGPTWAVPARFHPGVNEHG